MKNLILAVALMVSGWTVTPTADAARRCSSCGTVEDVDSYREGGGRGHGGAVVGAVLGAVIGNQVGSGSGRKVATVAGAVAGGAIGNSSDKRRGGQTVYEFRVRMDNGRTRSYQQYDNPNRLQRGDRVIVRNGYVELY